ncbi:MAG: hypothetical protein JW778_05995 [Candidatus Altiarchaeota archaeon]|nr:hypothetical protein [Candidatus Altiarchaeota archaeon]
MDTKHMMWIAVVFVLILSHHASAGYCNEELMDAEAGAHVVVSKCRNIGTFSLGGFYDGEWERLTYNYPEAWEGTFMSVYVDGRVYSNTMNPSSVRLDSSTFMDQYVEKAPQRIGNKIITVWRLPEQVIVEEILELVENGTKIHIRLGNKGGRDVEVGARLHLDTMLGENDGAPIYIPGDGLKSKESEYYDDGLDFRYWKAYNRGENATIISSGILYGEGLTYPDRLLVTDWKKSMYSSWDYGIDPGVTILGDSAVIIYYEPRTLSLNETRTILTAYKRGEPVLGVAKGSLGIADIVPEGVDDEHLPGENISFSVDVVSRDVEENTSVLVEVVDKEGKIVYKYNSTSDILEPDTVTPTGFGFQVPEDSMEGDFFDVRASLFKDGERVDQQSKRFTVSESQKGSFMLDDVRVTGSGNVSDIEVDLINLGSRNSGVLRIQVIKDGVVIYEATRSTDILNADTVGTYNFEWFHEGIDLDSFIVVVSLYRDYRKVDEIKKEFSFRFRLKDVRLYKTGEKQVIIEIDLVSSKAPNSGEVGLEVLSNGEVIHESMKATGIVPPFMTTTVNFTWIPEGDYYNPIFVAISLYKDLKKVDEITKELSFKTDDGGSPESVELPEASEVMVEEEDEVDEGVPYLQIAGLMLLILLFLFLNPVTRGKVMDTGGGIYGEIERRSQRKGSMKKVVEILKAVGVSMGVNDILKEMRDLKAVELEKLRDGENIVLIIKNRSGKRLRNCVVEDSLPGGGGVSMSDFHTIGKGDKLVVGRDDKLIWQIGTLLPGDTAILEYKMTGGKTMTPVRLKWDFGEKVQG